MKSPLAHLPLVNLQSVDSTQNFVAALLKRGEAVGAVLAAEQTAGRGRFDRSWHSPPGECLAVSLVFAEYVNHPKPYLIGMALAVSAALAFEAQVRWPNDIVVNDRKLGGILTELLPDANGRNIPVVGVGINLNQASFPNEISEIATSVRLEHGYATNPHDALDILLAHFEKLGNIPEWNDLQGAWMAVDRTPGKRYRLGDGREGIALSVGPAGELICTIDGKEERVLAADALLG